MLDDSLLTVGGLDQSYGRDLQRKIQARLTVSARCLTTSGHTKDESRYNFPGWPQTIRGRANLMAAFSGYGQSIQLHHGDSLVVHPARDPRVVILEYEVHGRILRTGASYDNRFISIITIENRKIVHWRDYMDSLAAWTALNNAS
jgi:ketosteroid isomerase-like protein